MAARRDGRHGAFPPINVFQQGDNLVAILEVPGVDKTDLEIQAKDNTIRISGKKAIAYPEKVSVHRRERLSGTFRSHIDGADADRCRPHQGRVPRRRARAFHPARRERQAAHDQPSTRSTIAN